jgi:hypothetical protein
VEKDKAGCFHQRKARRQLPEFAQQARRNKRGEVDLGSRRVLLVIQDGYTFQSITGYNMAVRESGIKYYGILRPSFLIHKDLQDKHLPLVCRDHAQTMSTLSGIVASKMRTRRTRK